MTIKKGAFGPRNKIVGESFHRLFFNQFEVTDRITTYKEITGENFDTVFFIAEVTASIATRKVIVRESLSKKF